VSSTQFDEPDPVTEFVRSNEWIMHPDANAMISYKKDEFAVYKKRGWRKKWERGLDLFEQAQYYPMYHVENAARAKGFKPKVDQQYCLHYSAGPRNYEIIPGWGVSAGNLVACANINKGQDCLEEYVSIIKLLISQPDINALVWCYDGLMTVLCDEDA
jgi:hypothetical protein